MTTSPALRFLLRDEWTMGNGQCHECYGCKPRRGWWTDTVGHKPTCQLALAIQSLGGKVTWERKNYSRRRRILFAHVRKNYPNLLASHKP